MSIEPNRNIQPKPLTQAASKLGPREGELEDLYRDVGKKVTYWQGRLHKALTDWFKDTNEISKTLQDSLDRFREDVKTYRWMVSEYKAMQSDQARNNGSKSLVYNFPPRQVAKINQLFSDLGVSKSVIKFTHAQQNGHTMDQFTMTQFGLMVDAVQRGIVQGMADGTIMRDIDEIGSKIAQLRSKQTDDMFRVMYCYQNVRSNERALSGVMRVLTQIF